MVRERQLTVGILAHVDAGKTTLSEQILYRTGAIRKLGRVDHRTAFLDTDQIEQERGITVYSKEARFEIEDVAFTLLDTPGHADFGTEAERTLQVLDYAILLVSGADGIQGHTVTLWRLLARYQIPVFVFVNKMDLAGADKTAVLTELEQRFGGPFVDMAAAEREPEELAMCSEKLMNEYLSDGTLRRESVQEVFGTRQAFPVYFGAALKGEGVEEFLQGLVCYTRIPTYSEEFGARVYKITRDKQGVRQTHMKITGGRLQSKMLISGQDWEEKTEQLRLYSGTGFTMVPSAAAGTVCAVTGLTRTRAGEGLGAEKGQQKSVLEPTMTYELILPPETDPMQIFRKLKQLEEESPSLHLIWREASQEIHVQVMGDLELEILQRRIAERFDLNVTFGEGSLIYKETIAAPVIGIGHFEPLRHYAEVHLLMEPGEPGSGLVFDSLCSEDRLDRNWQRLILTHLMEREHPGVLTGSAVTDMKISILAGRAHQKHTEGGDFRQATYRAVRQGLRKGKSVLLEPVVSFRLTLPTEAVGRALSDLQRMGAETRMPETGETETVIRGIGPAATLREYQREVAAYTKGRGQFITSGAGYRPCHNADEIIEKMGYHPEQDVENPMDSVFCQHGAAVLVNWSEVDKKAHVESGYRIQEQRQASASDFGRNRSEKISATGEKELEEIFRNTYGESKRDEALRRAGLSRQINAAATGKRAEETPPVSQRIIKPGREAKPYLLVDGYNVIFAWEELAALARVNIDGAREALIEVLGNYQGYEKQKITVVFDGYRLAGNPGTRQQYGSVEVVYTKEAETADRYIEKTVYELRKEYDITVVSSDRMVQMTAFGDGALRISSREFYQEVLRISAEIREILQRQASPKNRPLEMLGEKDEKNTPQ